MHVMIDDPDDIMNYRIASHIMPVHQLRVMMHCAGNIVCMRAGLT